MTRKIIRITPSVIRACRLSACAALLAAACLPNRAAADASSHLLQSFRAEPLDEAAPRFTVVDIDGATFSLAEELGHPIVLHFWATWCKPCRDELPALAAAYRALADRDVRFIAISIDRDVPEPSIRSLAQQYALPFTVALASTGDVTEDYWSWGIPVTYFIDRAGHLRERFRGSRDWRSVAARQLLVQFIDSPGATH